MIEHLDTAAGYPHIGYDNTCMVNVYYVCLKGSNI
jgi:hypothetical protein